MVEILEAIFKVGASTLFNLLSFVFAGKILAVLAGPAGFGIFTILRQMNQNLYVLATFNGDNALVQGMASLDGEPKESYLVSVFWVYMAGTMAVAVALVLFAPKIALWTLGLSDARAVGLLRWMTLPLLAAGGWRFFYSVLNGARAVNRMVKSQVAGALATIVLLYPLGLLIRNGWQPAYALILAVPIVVSGLWSFLECHSGGWAIKAIRSFRFHLKVKDGKRFMTIAVPMLVTGLLGTGAQLMVNSNIATRVGLRSSGLYSVAWSLSMSYVTLLLNSYATYYLPTLCSSREPGQKATLMAQFLQAALVIAPLLIVSVIVMKPLVIRLMFTPAFLPSLKIMRWMLIGDYFKVISWVLAMPMIAFADMKTFMISEFIFAAATITANAFFVNLTHQAETAGIVFLVLYVIYFVFCLFYAAMKHQMVYTPKIWMSLALGAGVIGLASFCNWDTERVKWVYSAGLLALAGVVSVAGLDSKQHDRIRVIARRVFLHG